MCDGSKELLRLHNSGIACLKAEISMTGALKHFMLLTSDGMTKNNQSNAIRIASWKLQACWTDLTYLQHSYRHRNTAEMRSRTICDRYLFMA